MGLYIIFCTSRWSLWSLKYDSQRTFALSPFNERHYLIIFNVKKVSPPRVFLPHTQLLVPHTHICLSLYKRACRRVRTLNSKRNSLELVGFLRSF